MTETRSKMWRGINAVLMLAVAAVLFGLPAAAQDDYQDDPPDRVARLGYLEGSVSMQPAGESEWVGAVSNRPITTGDRIWADRDSRAEVELGSAIIRLAPNTGFSFLNLDDRTTQIELTAGSLNIRVRRLDRNDVFEIDTPNQAFSVFQPGNYRVDASEDGTYTVISVRDGEGESTGNGQTYTLHAGQQGTFSGTDSLNAEVVDIGGTDQFDSWCQTRDRRYDGSRSSRYVSQDVVGYEDLDDYGDWRDDPSYGHVWYPSRVDSGWAPYQTGHWDWISPWGWTWVDDAPWGYAPFHYGRWQNFGGRWGWIAGPVAVRPVYAPALVVFIGGGGGFGLNVGWFPLGPREVYVPSYRVSRGYVDRVNISNTNVNVTNITNVYNTTIINKTTNITNINYVNRNVRGAVTAVPQRTFVSAQPVNRARVTMNEREIASASLTTRVAVAPTRESVLGARANTANRVTAPPDRIRNRQVIAKVAPPPPPVPFARQQAELQKNPGQPLARREVQNLRPAGAPDAHPMVKVAPPGKPATPNVGRRDNQPNRPGNQSQPAGAGQSNNQPGNRPGNDNRPNNPGNDRTGSARPSAPAPDNTPDSQRPGNNRPDNVRPNERPNETPVHPDRTNGNANDNQPNARPNGGADARPNNRPDRPNGNATDNRPNDKRPNEQPNNPPDARPDNRPDRPNGNANDNRPNDKRPNEQPNNPPDARPNNRPDRPNGNANDNRPNENRPNDRPNNPPDARPNARPDRPDGNANDNRPNERPNNQPDRPNGNRNDSRPDAQPNNRPDRPVRNDRPPDARPNERPNRPMTPEERKQQQKEQKDKEERDKKNEKPPAQ